MTVAIHESDLDSRLDSFESRQEAEGCANLAEFLPHADHPQYLDILIELIRVDLEYGWRRGVPTPLDEYLARFPVLIEYPDRLHAICFEEYRQKLQAGESPDPAEYERRYPIGAVAWPSSLRRAGSNITHAPAADPRFPAVGERFLGFQLVGELGRGAFARVYLARQDKLSDRPVALKVSHDRFSEAGTLARLQHTHIVPIYSVHHHDSWEAVCMPYFGAHTLHDLLHTIRKQPCLPPSGRFIFDTVSGANQTTRLDSDLSPVVGETSARSRTIDLAAGFRDVSGLSYVESILLIAKKVAAGLAHAHERGIIHRDLKPANILLADDGEPMLLDFNLSDDLQSRRRPSEAFIGGTLPYMAPEQLEAFQNHVRGGDARSDLFSLGIILYELLSGKSPYPVRQGVLDDLLALSIEDRRRLPEGMLRGQTAVTPAVEAIVLKCLDPQPERRYQTAQQLRDDLDRQLNHFPLRHTREPSWRERTNKWMRRHPRLTSFTGVGSFAAILLVAMGCVVALRGERLAQLQSQETWREFQADLHHVQIQITEASLADRDRLELAAQSCRDALVRLNLKDGGDATSSPLVRRLSTGQREQLLQDAAELHFLAANVAGLQADFESRPQLRTARLEAALTSNRAAEKFLAAGDVPASILHQRAWLERELGIAPLTSVVESTTSTLRTTRDICQEASLLASQRRFREASRFWQQASLRDPRNVWVWYGLGNCLEQIEQSARAAECYSACIALNPEFFGWYFNRGRLRLQAKEFVLAREDFLRAAELNPHHAETHANLAIAQLNLKDFQAAVAAMRTAIDDGYAESRAYLILALAYEELGEVDAAEAASQKAASTPPRDENSWIARGVAYANQKPAEAVSDFDHALDINAHSLAALESKAHVLAEILHRTEEAVAVLDRAARYFPEHGPTLANRGVLLARLLQRENALRDAENALLLDHSPSTLYQVAGIHSLLSTDSPSDARRAIELLASSLRKGYGGELLVKDSDLDPIRNLPEFQRLRESIEVLGTSSAE